MAISRVIENYDYLFPNGKSINGDVATIWKAKNDKLDALTIFFDTLTLQVNTNKQWLIRLDLCLKPARTYRRT